MRILVAEDEIDIAKAIKYVLEKNKYTVDMCHDGQICLDNILYKEYDLVILDIMMPLRNGLDVLKEIRQKNINVPVLILSAKSEVDDRVVGLNLGADDYLSKPFSLEELLARVKAISRRGQQYHNSIKTLGNTSFDSDAYKIAVGDLFETLNNKEYQIIDLLIAYPNVVFSSEKIMEKIWDADSNASIDVVWTYIGYLRKKLKNIHSNLEIKTVRNAGYCIRVIDD